MGGTTNRPSCTIYATKEDQESMAQEEEDIIARCWHSLA